MSRRPSFAVETLGCKANQYDSHALRADLRQRGLTEVEFAPGADAYVVNTCSVTSMAGQKSRKMIGGLARENPDAVVVVTGCYADTDFDELVRTPGVSRVFRNADKGFIGRFVAEAVERGVAASRSEDDAHDACSRPALPARVVDFGNQTRPFVKIQDGCDLLCTYCIIPTTRGGLASRPLEHVVDEIAELTAAGHPEIVLTGIHLGGYGHDVGRPDLLLTLLDRLLELPDLVRLRLSSIEVQEVGEGLVERVAGSDRLCPHFHIPLQSGSDAVLRRMGRRYRVADYLATVERIAAAVDGVAFNTDVIVGFPGETEADFEATCRLAARVGFSRIHLFPYSDRPGTPSVRLAGKVDPETLGRRKAALGRLAGRLGRAFHERLVGRRLRVLVEGDGQGDRRTGYSDEYVRVDFGAPDVRPGSFQSVVVERAGERSVEGRLAP